MAAEIADDMTPRGAPRKPTRALVHRVAERIFGPRQATEVIGVLDRYGTEHHEHERERVQIAILKLCEERAETDLAGLVATAKQDYRDILQAAEYPRLSAHPPQLDEHRRAVLRRADRARLS